MARALPPGGRATARRARYRPAGSVSMRPPRTEGPRRTKPGWPEAEPLTWGVWARVWWPGLPPNRVDLLRVTYEDVGVHPKRAAGVAISSPSVW